MSYDKANAGGTSLRFEIILAPRVVRSVRKLPKADRDRIDEILGELARGAANLHFRKLQGYEDCWRLRKDPWRVLFELDGARIYVIKVDRRDDAYRK